MKLAPPPWSYRTLRFPPMGDARSSDMPVILELSSAHGIAVIKDFA